ncbi:Secretory peroxidase [Sesbania bispinosa]|nr:Secretory peroxidase [Sesbania bispinosa]
MAKGVVHGGDTRVGFYSSTCPRAESIVKSTIKSHVKSDPTLGAGLLRMHFHDCFVEGCDGSVLIVGSDTERTASPNLSLRGFEVIDDAKTLVSCADILALAARDSVVLLGGPSWKVPTGRRDGRVSKASDVNLPGPGDSVDVQKQKFAAKGLNTQDLVALVGGHTIGTAACAVPITTSLYNFTRNGPDPSIDPSFLPQLQALCPQNNGGSNRVALDDGSQNKFDTSYFYNLRKGRGILQSDQALWNDDDYKGHCAEVLGWIDIQCGIWKIYGEDEQHWGEDGD